MKNKRAANITVAIVSVAIVTAGVLLALFVGGVFDLRDEIGSLTDPRGIVTIIRAGFAYTVSDDTTLHSGDRVFCESDASCKIAFADGYASLGGNANVRFDSDTEDRLLLEFSGGEVFVNTSREITVSVFEEDFAAEGAVSLAFDGVIACAEVHMGSFGDAIAGETLTVGGGETIVGAFAPDDISEFSMAQLKLAYGTYVSEPAYSETDAPGTTYTADTSSPDDGDTQATEAVTADDAGDTAEVTESAPVLSCTLSIRCDRILDRLSALDPAKRAYIPTDGMIMYETEMRFHSGDSVFDVLARACRENGIQLEYSYTPLYSTYYVEGIGDLYEFDCGAEYGWKYRVNGTEPNYGSSEYYLTGGEEIVWTYSSLDDTGE